MRPARSAVVAVLLLASCAFEPPDDPACRHHEFSLRAYLPTSVRVDVLIWIDDSPSMVQEQAALALQLPMLIRELIAPEDRDGDGRPDHPAVEDLNVGILAPGMPSTNALPGCSAEGTAETGCLLRRPQVPSVGCADSYPPFRSWSVFFDDATDAERVANDVACTANVGTSGCTYQQPFAAVARALTDQAAPGGCNQGFLRDDALLYVLWISDADDGSVSPAHPELFDPDEPLGVPPVRSALHPELLEPVETFVEAFRATKPEEDADKVVLGMVVGVPPDVPQCRGAGDELAGCVESPAMQVLLDPADPRELVPSCRTTPAMATPPRRFVELAEQLGSSAAVESICLADWRGVLRPVTDRIVEHLPVQCFPRELPLAEGRCIPSCAMVETLSTARPCLEDPACLASWCPPAVEGDALALPPCVDPSTGRECRPFKRDLGVERWSDGSAHRLCLMRASPRTRDPADGRCSDPEEAGWFYVSRNESPIDCPRLLFFFQGSISAGGVEPGSTAELFCGSTVCENE